MKNVIIGIEASSPDRVTPRDWISLKSLARRDPVVGSIGDRFGSAVAPRSASDRND